MKVASSVKRRCKKCAIIRRRSGRTGNPVIMVVCDNPRHKQRQG